jgi:hypothetical protein
MHGRAGSMIIGDHIINNIKFFFSPLVFAHERFGKRRFREIPVAVFIESLKPLLGHFTGILV